jgi:hypothetical protein
MTFLEALRSHKGGLVRIKSQLYWYGRGWDGVHDRVCLLLNAAASPPSRVLAAARQYTNWGDGPAALLLVDGAPHWVWVAPANVELLS